MNNKNVLITGGDRGIGSSTAEVFAKNGFNIIINYYQNKIEAEKLKLKLISQYGINCECYKCDVSNEEEVNVMFNKIEKNFGHIDCLINNAGIAIDNDFNDKSVEEFRRVIDVNLNGIFIITKRAIKLMKKGSIINVSSTDGIDTNYEYEIDYAASKAGVISLTKTLSKILSPNIRVNAVAPGWVETDMNYDVDCEFKKKETNKILLNRFAHPIEIASVIYFLSTDAASYINGTVIRVDGGIKNE